MLFHRRKKEENVSGDIESLVQQKELLQKEVTELNEELAKLRQKLDESKLDIANEEGMKREELVQEITGEIIRVNESFKLISDTMTKEIDANMKNAINELVLLKRKIDGIDFEALLENYSDLQESIYYNSDEQALEIYLKRFLRCIASYGYKYFIPEVGSKFDDYYHEEVDAKNDCAENEQNDDGEIYVAEVVSYGFEKDDYCVLRAKVTTTRK